MKSLGPDAPLTPEVEIEIRAAELIAYQEDWKSGLDVSKTIRWVGPELQAFGALLSSYEKAGWECHMYCSTEPCLELTTMRDEEAGWLAREIVMHEGEP